MADEQAITKTTAFGGGASMVPGRKPSSRGDDIKLSRLVFYTGTQQDKKNYGPHEDGMFLDEMDGTEFGKEVNVALVGVVGATYARWDKGQSTPTYSYRSWQEVPPEHRGDFEWHDHEPPVGTETINVVLLLLDDQYAPVGPYLFRFKRTSMPAWDGPRGIEKNETAAAARDGEGFGACIYRMFSENEKNAAKQDYLRLNVRMIKRILPGDPLRHGMELFRSGFESLRAKAEQIEDAESDEGGGDMPPM